MSSTDPHDASALAFAARLHQAISVARLHSMDNVAAQAAAEELRAGIEASIDAHGSVAVRAELEADMLFVEGRPIRAKRASYQIVEGLLRIFGQLGIGELRFARALDLDQVKAFLGVIREPGEPGATPATLAKKIQVGVAAAGLRASVEVLSQAQAATRAVEKVVQVDADLYVRLAYARVLSLVREHGRHMRDQELHRYFWRKLVRAVQGVISLALQPRSRRQLLGLTLLKEADDPHWNRAVNTCILSVLVGQKAGFGKPALVQLGLAALLHGVGEFRTDPEVLARDPAARTATEEREWTRRHVRALGAFLESRRFDEQPLACALVAIEHDLSPGEWVERGGEGRKPHVFSRIVSVCAAWDELTSPTPWRAPLLPDEALAQLVAQEPRPHDPTVLALLVNLLGLYPPGTAVLLDSGAVGVVVHPNPDDPARPVVAIVRDAKGADAEGDILDLASRSSSGRFVCSIARPVDPAKLGVTIPEYLRG